jgi:hypothetical protein
VVFGRGISADFDVATDGLALLAEFRVGLIGIKHLVRGPSF